ncbi:MAG: hypothetical protein WBA74_03985, partial [Cyclobacteriaceae bacterium]
MTKILSYHKFLEGEGFLESGLYGQEHIRAIPDTDKELNKNLPTSIPSPFAAIDLTANAFRELANSKNMLKGHAAYEKLVSRALDVGMVFFYYENLKQLKKVRLHRWNRQQELQKLSSSKSRVNSWEEDENSVLQSGKLLADTLNVHMEADHKRYNFKELKDLFMVSVNHTLVGCTSPRTLFFGSLNPLELDSNNHIKLGFDQTVFSDTTGPLYERPKEFQLYLYSLRKQIKKFGSNFKEIDKYLDANLEILKNKDRSLYNQIEEIKAEQYNDAYTPVITPENIPVKVLNTEIKAKNLSIEGYTRSSFGINSRHLQDVTDRPPLILASSYVLDPSPSVTYYFDCKIDDELKGAIPMSSDLPLEERRLPGMEHVKYPHLLVGDFFSDKLFVVESFQLNQKHFLAYKLETKNDTLQVLCPLKANAFNYVDTDYITDPNNFFLEADGDDVVVTLVMETEKGKIKLQKTYRAYKDEINPEDGEQVVHEVDVNIYPFIKDRSTDQKIIYRTHFTYLETHPKIAFYRGKNIPLEAEQSHLKAEASTYAYQTFLTTGSYDYIVLTDKEGNEATLVPRWLNEFKAQNRELSFAIDFGTTNTYIAYKVDKRESETLNQNEELFTFFSDQSDSQKPKVTKEFMPSKLEEGTNYRFPQRTVIAITKGINTNDTKALADMRIPFYYETDSHTETSTYHNNLKWMGLSSKENRADLVKGFLEQLVLIMKTKALELGIKPDKCNFIWSYPSSMSGYRKDNFEGIWRELIRQHFNTDEQSTTNKNRITAGAGTSSKSGRITALSESLAPFYFYDSDMYNSFIYPGITRDIGGGTTDVIIFHNSKPLKLISYRYAANTVFGDGYRNNPQKNGFILKYKDRFMQKLQEAKLDSAIKAINDLLEQGEFSSADLMSTFLSQDDNTDNLNSGNSKRVNIQQILAEDGEMKIVFFVFYYSLIYHIAKHFKECNIELPGQVLFSGNGSKMLRILDSSPDFRNLAAFTKRIIEKVSNVELPHDVSLNMGEEPKTITAKGSLKSLGKTGIDPESLKVIMPGTKLTERSTLPYYRDLEDHNHSLIGEVTDDVVSCFKMLQEILSEFDTYNRFLINNTTFENAVDFLLEKHRIK